MKVLAIDTSTSCLSVAIREECGLIAECSSIGSMKHSANLMPMVDRCLKLADLSIETIDGFAVSLGPGSFTGLRIGVATMKGLAFALKKPIVGIPTLDVLAENIPTTTYQILPILDAKRRQVYASIYKYSASKLKRKTFYLVIGIDDLLKRVRSKTIFLGEGLKEYRDVINRKKKGLVIIAARDYWFPRASIVAKKGLERLIAGKVDHSFDIVPLYLRPPEAIEKAGGKTNVSLFYKMCIAKNVK